MRLGSWPTFLLWLVPIAHAADPVELLDPEKYSASTLLEAMELIKDYFPPRSVERLSGLLGHYDPQVVRTAAWLLRRMGQGATGRQAAASVLSSPQASMEARVSAALALGELRDAGGIEPLLTALSSDPSEDVRTQAALSLGNLRLAGIASRLSVAFSDTSARVRAAVVKALGLLPDVSADTLLAFLADENYTVRRQAAWSLGQKKFRGQSVVIGRLVQMLQQDSDCDCRAAAAWALGVLADPSSRAALEAIAEEPCRRSYQAVRWALSQIE